jgi:serine/threonine-protein kinase
MSHTLPVGALFAGRYRVLGVIAAGGMGAVYEVLHVETERRRALKVMLPSIVGSAELRERFKREAKIAANVASEHIVDVFDAGVDDATQMPFLVMELLAGEELGKRLKRIGAFAPGDVLTYLHQTARALDKTHKASIVHRDLKPENLFLTETDDGAPRIKVLDFGIAKLVAEGTTSGGATQSLGTPLYMAPEQFRMDARLSGATDVYALGMIAYTLLVGVPYWKEELGRGGNVFAFAGVAMFGPKEPATARAVRAGRTLPPAFDAWFATATSAQPEARFASASAAIAALAQVLEVAAISVTSTSVPAVSPPAALPAAPVAAVVAETNIPTILLAPTPAAPRAPLPSGATLGTIAVTESATMFKRPELPAKPPRRLLVGGAVTAGVLVLGAAIFYGARGTSPAAEGAGERAVPASTVVITATPAVTAAPEPAPVASSAPAATTVESALPSASASAPQASARPVVEGPVSTGAPEKPAATTAPGKPVPARSATPNARPPKREDENVYKRD